MNPPNTETLVEAYFGHVDWEAQRERAENTSEAVRTLADKLLTTRDELGSKELTALYNLAQHQNSYGREKKREAVDQFDISSGVRETIHDCIDGPIGIVGSGTYTVDVDGEEELVTEFLNEFVYRVLNKDLDLILEKFASDDVSGIQAGIISTLAYALYPTEFPLANSPAREGLADYFGYEVSDQLTDYPDTVEAFRTVRDEYGFASDFRHLDYFFQWAAANPTGNPDDPGMADVTHERADAYWVNQNDEQEMDEYYLRAPDDDYYTHRADRLTEDNLVFHNFNGELCAISRATGDIRATYDDDEDYEITHLETHQIEPTVSKDDVVTALDHDPFRLDDYYPVSSNGKLNQGYLFELSDEAANWLLGELGIKNPEWKGPDGPRPPERSDSGEPPDNAEETEDTDSDDPLPVPDSPPPRHEEITRQLNTTGQVVLSGPPGTGKTHTATRSARSWVDDHTDGEPSAEQVRTVTFHPAFAYEDFLEGLTAKTTDDGDVVYDEEPGHFYEIAKSAREAYDPTADTNPPYVLVVDEINRGDLPQILGEAITLLEPGKRGEHEIDLAHSGKSFTLPPNLYLIGTMNTADQSIGLVDAALRRRFRFLRFPPEPERVAEIELDDDADGADAVLDDPEATSHERLVAASVSALGALNERICTDASRLERGQQLGHTALLGHDTPQDVADAWRFQLLPQLAEYYYGQMESLRRELFDGAGDSALFDWEHGTVGDFDPETLYDALCDLADADAVGFEAGPGDGEPGDAVDGEAATTASDE